MPTKTSTRRPATPADMIPGATVYKGNGKTEWIVRGAEDVGHGYTHYRVMRGPAAKSGCLYTADEFTVEA